MATATSAKINFNIVKNHSEIGRWICIYPAYINSKKTRQEGRKLSKENCCENPTYTEIRDVLSALGFPFVIEDSQYPREKSKEMACRGRLRVQLKTDQGTPLNPEYPTRDSILCILGNKIPQLKTRQNKSGDTAQTQQTPAGGGGAGGHKKGKGKRR